MRRFFLLVTIIVTMTGCEKESTDKCIDSAKRENGACTYIYDPVCGCNGVTYGNECEARVAGVVTWTKGECNK